MKSYCIDEITLPCYDRQLVLSYLTKEQVEKISKVLEEILPDRKFVIDRCDYRPKRTKLDYEIALGKKVKLEK